MQNLNDADPIRRLRAIAGLRLDLDRWQYQAIAEARVQGHSWGEIGLALGVRPEAASRWQKRHADR